MSVISRNFVLLERSKDTKVTRDSWLLKLQIPPPASDCLGQYKRFEPYRRSHQMFPNMTIQSLELHLIEMDRHTEFEKEITLLYALESLKQAEVPATVTLHDKLQFNELSQMFPTLELPNTCVFV